MQTEENNSKTEYFDYKMTVKYNIKCEINIKKYIKLSLKVNSVSIFSFSFIFFPRG